MVYIGKYSAIYMYLDAIVQKHERHCKRGYDGYGVDHYDEVGDQGSHAEQPASDKHGHVCIYDVHVLCEAIHDPT